ncbi:hypothetical protein Ocin01_03503 [Orchesella cincta]|uniref:Uncharacterized protein n=1 Tax=Orchesella cincta TaxID=48709 RepID=A0A1D2ND43_ORCCI|nr:hypothetical protein Ocin01_03503 [Orchesella cincta]
MRVGMGNLLETDSDVASISDNEKERTDGDGMESDALDANKQKSGGKVTGSTTLDANSSGDKTTDETISSSCVSTNSGASDVTNHSSSSSCLSSAPQSSTHNQSSTTQALSDLNQQDGSRSCPSVSGSEASSHASTATSKTTTSPRELPPRSQLIQLKPVMSRPKLNSKNSMDSSSDTMNKQKNPKFVPYEPYRCAVRPITEDESSAKHHSRTASDTSLSSISFEIAAGNEPTNSITDIPLPIDVLPSPPPPLKDNTHIHREEERNGNKGLHEIRMKKQDQIIQKQTHSLTLLKERLKIAEKDNHDLHKENIRLKKLLVDSLSGDLYHSMTDGDLVSSSNTASTNESVDTLSNEIEVFRSKFLSSCVLVEQLTRENGVLNDAMGCATNIFRDLKLTGSLTSTQYEEINAWLRINRTSSSPPPTKDEPQNS